MLALSELPAKERHALEGLLFDLDDTFLDHGRLDASAYSVLVELAERGLTLIGVTGRPASWGQVLARQWPVTALLTENGAIAYRRQGGGVRREDALSDAERSAQRARLRQLVECIRGEFPELTPSDDCDGRVSDYTFDIGERQRVEPSRVRAVARRAEELGARTVASSVHLHVSLDQDDKATGTLRWLAANLGVGPTAARARFAFIGDSENDAPCFAAFHTSIGVANLAGRFSVPPRYITKERRSRGFVEAARALFGADTARS